MNKVVFFIFKTLLDATVLATAYYGALFLLKAIN